MIQGLPAGLSHTLSIRRSERCLTLSESCPRRFPTSETFWTFCSYQNPLFRQNFHYFLLIHLSWCLPPPGVEVVGTVGLLCGWDRVSGSVAYPDTRIRIPTTWRLYCHAGRRLPGRVWPPPTSLRWATVQRTQPQGKVALMLHFFFSKSSQIIMWYEEITEA